MVKLARARAAREAAEGWPLPGYVMECESRYHNEPPHEYAPGIDPSGYEQIIKSTWLAHGGGEFASEAWLATRREQAIVTRRILASGGLREWQCA